MSASEDEVLDVNRFGVENREVYRVVTRPMTERDARELRREIASNTSINRRALLIQVGEVGEGRS